MQEALDWFHPYRVAFETAGVRSDGFPSHGNMPWSITSRGYGSLALQMVFAHLSPNQSISEQSRSLGTRRARTTHCLKYSVQISTLTSFRRCVRSLSPATCLTGDVLADALGLNPEFMADDIAEDAADEAEDEVEGVDGEAEGVIELPQ